MKKNFDPELVSNETIEEWRPVVGYEGLYEVSSKGNVKSIERKDSNNHLLKERLLKFNIGTGGYLGVHLCKNGIRKPKMIQRLVAIAFIPNPNNLPQVNHKDEDKTNNCVENLEWCTAKYNANYGTRNERVVQKRRKEIIQYSLDKKIIRKWNCSTQIEKELGYARSNICNCCKNKYKTAYGYIWRFKEK